MIENNVRSILSSISDGNCFHEQITLVAATKMRTPEEINRAIRAGITDIGENRVQEFREKNAFVMQANRHFIGHLQTNKVKYLIGKIDLIHSVDRDELADAIETRSLNENLRTDILIQINIGNEASKGGYRAEEGRKVYERFHSRAGLRVRGYMAMLPNTTDGSLLNRLCDDMRALYDDVRKTDPDICFLSLGMSGDWERCVSRGSNMIRIGTAIFGAR